MKPTFGSLFAGIGGIDLGLERAGWECKWQVENDAYATRVLEKHWPEVRRWGDVQTFPPGDDFNVFAITAGFPCQDISSNNQYKRGLDGKSSSLWFEVPRIIRIIRPQVVILENVADLLVRGMGTVLENLAACGFNAWWECFPAATVGVPQRRWRTFIVAYADSLRFESRDKWVSTRPQPFEWGKYDRLGEAARRAKHGACFLSRMDDGLPNRVDRLRSLGNAVCPQVAQWIGTRILESLDTGPGSDV